MKTTMMLALALAAPAAAEVLTLTAERTLPAPPAQVYRALTQPYYLERWWGAMARRERQPVRTVATNDGGEVRATFAMNGATLERHTLEDRRAASSTTWLIDFGMFKARRVLTLVPDGGGTRVRWFEIADVAPGIKKMLDLSVAQKNRDMALEALGEVTSTLREP